MRTNTLKIKAETAASEGSALCVAANIDLRFIGDKSIRMRFSESVDDIVAADQLVSLKFQFFFNERICEIIFINIVL